MCGIAFLAQPTLDHARLIEHMTACLNRQRHRGPDESGMQAGDGWIIGHRRLSIIDLAASHQPMCDPSSRFWLSFNGEIYNFRQLREQLASAWSFETSGDTEVLLAGLVRHGQHFIGRLEGMWSFALWDSHAGRLLLSRDRMGKKPLYYRPTAGGIACSSELPALKLLSPGDWREDLDSSADYLRYGYQLPGHTAFAGISEVLPGHTLAWQADGRLEQAQYWRLNPGTRASSHGQAVEQLREALTDAVSTRLVADVEVGAFLSGGVDSSLVAGIVRRRLNRPLKTFTVGFEDPAYDERGFAQLAAEAFATEHHADVMGDWDEQELERLVFEHVGQPFADSSLLPTMLVSRVAARHVKVALSGDGGDELFSGYQRYQARQLLRWYTRLPRCLRANTSRLVRLFPEPTAHHSRSLIKKAHLFLDVASRIEAETPYFAPWMFTPSSYHAIAPELAGRGHEPPGIPETTMPDDIHRMMSADALIYLPQDILVKVDRASMAHSLEVRAPFLDRRVVELAFSLPRSWHRRGFSGKRMLHDAFGGLLPPTIWRRRKQGFGVPIHQWFRGELGDKLRALLEESPHPLASQGVLDLLDQHRLGQRDHGHRLWLIYVYLLWRSRSPD